MPALVPALLTDLEQAWCSLDDKQRHGLLAIARAAETAPYERIAILVTIARLDAAELAVVARVAARLAMGAEQYGPLDPIHDKRRWLDELRDELLDALVYLDCESERTR